MTVAVVSTSPATLAVPPLGMKSIRRGAKRAPRREITKLNADDAHGNLADSGSSPLISTLA